MNVHLKLRGILALTVAWLPATALAEANCRPVFEERFDGITLNRDRWATRYIYDGGRLDHLNDEAQRYRDNGNHVVQHGILSLVARPVADGSFESGMIRSRQTFRYGYFEARVRLPHGRGVWPAFWLNPDKAADGSLTWPPEIDVFEYAVNGRDDTASMLHSGVHAAWPEMVDWRDISSSYNPVTGTYRHPVPLDRGWHVFGLSWRMDNVTVWLDGKKLYRRGFRWLGRDGKPAAPAHILLNFAVGGNWAGRYGIDRNRFPQSFDIDYVRVCEFSNS